MKYISLVALTFCLMLGAGHLSAAESEGDPWLRKVDHRHSVPHGYYYPKPYYPKRYYPKYYYRDYYGYPKRHYYKYKRYYPKRHHRRHHHRRHYRDRHGDRGHRGDRRYGKGY